VSWDDIDAVCPSSGGGVCGGESITVLNGYDMRGWIWASSDDAFTLYNYYIGSPLLTQEHPSQQYFLQGDFAWVLDFMTVWHATAGNPDYGPALFAWVRDLNSQGIRQIGFVTLVLPGNIGCGIGGGDDGIGCASVGVGDGTSLSELCLPPFCLDIGAHVYQSVPPDP